MHYKRKPNAIIENMEHHGRGIYSGTFSGMVTSKLPSTVLVFYL